MRVFIEGCRNMKIMAVIFINCDPVFISRAWGGLLTAGNNFKGLYFQLPYLHEFSYYVISVNNAVFRIYFEPFTFKYFFTFVTRRDTWGVPG